MNKNLITLFFIMGIIFFPENLIAEQNEKFELTTKPQETVFYIGFGWTGGMGSMPILDFTKERPKKYEDLPIFFDATKKDEIRAKLPKCYSGTPTIKIQAKIRLVRKSGHNYSIEEAPVQSYYEATAENIHNIEVKAKECNVSR